MLAAIMGPWFIHPEDLHSDMTNMLQGPSASHPLGTDHMGRDTLKMIIFGAREVLSVALITAVMTLIMATVMGMLAAFTKGAVNGILNILIDDDVSFLQKTEKSLIALEDSLNVCHDDAFDVRIMPYRRLMVRFQAYYYQLMNVGMSFRSNINNMLCEEDVMSFTYYTRRAEMLHVQVQALRDYIFQIRETYRTDIAVRQNRSMNLLTVISALFMPLTLIAGWYGMNFLYMPELKSPYGYSAVIAVSCVIVIAEIIYFRKKHIL